LGSWRAGAPATIEDWTKRPVEAAARPSSYETVNTSALPLLRA